MPTEFAIPPVSRWVRGVFWLFHLWNLDAPSVAVLWQVLFARCFRIPINASSVLALAVSVWLIYATDHLLDVNGRSLEVLTKRHAFHSRHRKRIFAAVLIGAVALTLLCTRLLPAVFESGLLLLGIVALYFLEVHLLPSAIQRWLPKEVLVGILFAAGSCLAPWCRAERPSLLALPAFFFAALCCLNCVAIEVWEWKSYAGERQKPPVFATLWLSRHLRFLLWAIAVSAAFLLALPPSRLLFAAILLSAGAFLLVDSLRHRLPVDFLRVVADVPMFSPLLLLLGSAAGISLL